MDVDRTLFEDTSITQTDNATVLAYTEIETAVKFYDRAKKWLYDNYNGETATIVSRASDTIDLGSYDLEMNGDTSDDTIFDFDGSTITINGTSFTGTITTTGTVTVASDVDTSAAVISDASGTSSSINVSGLTSSNVLLYNKTTDATIDFQTSQTGSYGYGIAATADNNYSVKVRRLGYTEAELDFDPSGGGAFALATNLSQRLSLTAAPLYAGSGNDANISFDWANKLILLQGSVSFSAQNLYDMAQRAQFTENGMKLDPIMDFDGRSNLLLLDGWQIANGDALTPTISAFITTDDSRDIISTGASVLVEAAPNATSLKQDQLIQMLERVQGSSWAGTEFTSNGIDLHTLPNTRTIRDLLD